MATSSNGQASPKPSTTTSEQLLILRARGLVITDEAAALRVLEHHNYYRLSVYRLPFTLPGDADQFVPGTTFEQIWGLYQFDQTLRALVWSGCERVEISLRARWAYEVAHALGPVAYTRPAYAQNASRHNESLKRLRDELHRSSEEFVKHHTVTLGQEWPPSWVVAEVATFGTISMLVKNIRDPVVRQRIATSYQLDERVVGSVMHHLSVVRNFAAHHSRLWNRIFVNPPRLPRTPRALSLSTAPESPRNIYNSLVLLAHLIQCIQPGDPWPRAVRDHLHTLDPALLPRLGAPGDWSSRPLWAAL